MSSITQSQNQHLAGQPGKATNTGWTDADKDVLRKAWRAGASARAIAESLGGRFTRNAIIGAAHRLGLSRDHKPFSRKPRAPRPPAAPKPTPERRTRFQAVKPPEPEQVENLNRFEDPSDGVGVSFLELTNESCRWPKGTPGEPGFVFCGEATADLRDGKPYCPFHMRKRRVS